MSYYQHSSPAAANYNTPPTGHIQKQRGVRVCDHCRKEETPYIPKFNLCGACYSTQYCSPACQKSHWPAHKAICQHTNQQLLNARLAHAPNNSNTDENLARYLRKFSSSHTPLLTWVAYQALQVKRVPANARQCALIIELSFRGPGVDSARLFTVSSTHVVDRSYVRDTTVLSEIQARDKRARQQGGLGALVVSLQCGGISQLMPVEIIDHPSTITWDIRDDWEQTLRHFVDGGRTDFMPISTSKRGVRYG